MKFGGRNHEVDMLNGPVLGKIIEFSFPLMLTSLLQLFYNAADIIVVGRYAGSSALAAVGANNSLIALIVNLFLGMSVGTSVVVARHYGAGDIKSVSNALHTSIALSTLFGIFVAVFGISLAPTLLGLMSCPEDVMDQAVLYLRLYLLGIPASMIYNFASAAMRAIGDTRRPLFYLTVSGLVNVTLNLIFVICFHMGVAGVAVATAVSQIVALVLIIIRLLNTENCIRLMPSRIRFHKEQFKEIIRIGLPAGLQSTLFSISNVLIQSSINSFGSTVMAANAAAQNLDSFNSSVTSSVAQAALTFCGQNIGAKKYYRIPRIMRTCLPLVFFASLVVGGGIYLGGPVLLKLYTTEADVINYAMIRLLYIGVPYCLAGLMDTMSFMLRGLGYSLTPMLVTTVGVCVFRIIWVLTVFAANRSLETLYISYPISWGMTAIVHMLCFFFVWKFKIPQRAAKDGGQLKEIK